MESLDNFPFFFDFTLESFSTNVNRAELIRREISHIAQDCENIKDIALLEEKIRYVHVKLQDLLELITRSRDLVPYLTKVESDRTLVDDFLTRNAKQACDDLSSICERLNEVKALGFMVLVPTSSVDPDNDEIDDPPSW